VRGRGRGRATGTGSTSERAGSRFNSKYFGEIIAQLDDRKKDIVRDRGFGILLQYDGCSAPKGFIQWISDQLDLNCSDFLVGGKIIPLSTLSAHLFLGLPMEGEVSGRLILNPQRANSFQQSKSPLYPLSRRLARSCLEIPYVMMMFSGTSWWLHCQCSFVQIPAPFPALFIWPP